MCAVCLLGSLFVCRVPAGRFACVPCACWPCGALLRRPVPLVHLPSRAPCRRSTNCALLSYSVAAQSLVRWLTHFFRVVLVDEAWSTSTCLRCFSKWQHVQRMNEIEGDHDHMWCRECGKVDRDPNAAGWIKVYAEFYAATGWRHPVSLDTREEAATRLAGRSAKPAKLKERDLEVELTRLARARAARAAVA